MADELPEPSPDSSRPVSAEEAETLLLDGDLLERSESLSQKRRQPPLTLPGYAFQRCLGDGAFGSVWLARELNTGRSVAVKVYTQQGRLDWTLLSREVEKLAALDSSRHIVDLLGVGWDSDPPYYVMEYLENGSLARYLADGALPVPEAVRLAHGVLQGLVHAHGRGILHCDLKPGNVLLDDDFQPRLCDFGQSRLSHEQDPALGTLYYMAPEQADLEAIPDARWDVYALGALLYHLLTGGPPYRSPAAESMIGEAGPLPDRLAAYQQLVASEPRPSAHRQAPGIDTRLSEIVDRCLRTDPDGRYPNAQAVLDALQARERQRARRPLIALGGIAPVLLLAAMFLFGLGVMDNAVQIAESNLAHRALESDRLSSRIFADGVQRELAQWAGELQKLADSPGLAASITAASAGDWKQRDAVVAPLESAREQHDLLRKSQARSPDTSWFLVDHRGVQRWRSPRSEETLDRSWAHRDYFHGHGEEYLPDRLPSSLAPITAWHLSLAFRSKATNLYMVALSVPVKDANGRVVAVFAGTRHLGQVLSGPYANYKLPIAAGTEEGVGRLIAVADRRDGKLLDHPWMTSRQTSGKDPEPLPLKPSLVEKLNRRAAHGPGTRETHVEQYYQDPSAASDNSYRGAWLAAFSDVGQTGWVAIVQEPRREALRPVGDMKANLVRTLQLGLAASAAVITLMWVLVLRGINRMSPTTSLRPGHSPEALSTTVRDITPTEPPGD